MKTCEVCGNLNFFKVEFFGSGKILSCPICSHNIYEACKHPKSEPVLYTQNDKLYIKELCVECQSMHGSFLKQSLFDLKKIRKIDKDKYDTFQEDKSKLFTERRAELVAKHNEWRKQSFFNAHNNYLKSPTWKEKRDEVLKRDNYLCQSCLKARATEVHHLSYAHWQQEPLFELVSICHECHEIITKIDQSK